jgi:hypothetical protein
MTELESKIKNAIKNKDKEELDSAILEILLAKNYSDHLDVLNELLLVPFHYHHQEITRVLQDIKSPSSVPYIRKVFETGFDYLDYNFSGFGAIAKWFSWALYSIGTTEAIDLMKEYANSADEEIRQEMRYRLNKLKLVEKK